MFYKLKCRQNRIEGLFTSIVESWKDIPGYENIYQISSFGNVKSLERYKQGPRNTIRLVKERILKPKNNKGYLAIHLRTGKNLYPSIHTLVAKAFIKNESNKNTVNHINGVKSSNNIANLEWATESEQMVHAIKTGLYTPPDISKYTKKGSEHPNSKINENDVQKIKDLKNSGNTYKSIAKEFNLGISQVFRICKNQSRVNNE